MKTIGIVGSRRRNTMADYLMLVDRLEKIYEEGDRFVSGGCPKGGDSFAQYLADTYGIPILVYPAEWEKYGRGAGFRRNTFIARDADVLIAIVAADRKGGTEDTIKKFISFHPDFPLILI